MAKYKFLRSVGCKTLDGRHQKDFSVGVHDVDDVYLKTPAFLSNVKAGNIVDPESKVAVTTETVAERAKKLHDKIAKSEVSDSAKLGTANGEVTPEQAEKLKEEKDNEEWAKLEAEEASEKKAHGKHAEDDKKKRKG